MTNQTKFIKGMVETHDCKDDIGQPCDNYMLVGKWGDWDGTVTT